MTELSLRSQSLPGPLERPLIELAGVEKVYRTGKVAYRALRGVDLTIDAGEMVAIVGPSGSGKSTIMNMITGIDRPTAGTVTVDGRRIDEMSEEELAVWRGARVGRRVPVLPAAADADRARERDAAARLLAPRAPARAPRDRAAQPRARRAGRQGRQPAGRALRRPAAARRDRPRARRRPAAADRRRADRQPRHGAPPPTCSTCCARLNAEGSTILYVTHDLELAARAHRTVTIRDGVVAA